MTEIGPTPGRPDSDIYTILLMLATIFLLVGTAAIAVRAQHFFGSWLPLGL